MVSLVSRPLSHFLPFTIISCCCAGNWPTSQFIKCMSGQMQLSAALADDDDRREPQLNSTHSPIHQGTQQSRSTSWQSRRTGTERTRKEMKEKMGERRFLLLSNVVVSQLDLLFPCRSFLYRVFSSSFFTAIPLAFWLKNSRRAFLKCTCFVKRSLRVIKSDEEELFIKIAVPTSQSSPFLPTIDFNELLICHSTLNKLSSLFPIISLQYN